MQGSEPQASEDATVYLLIDYVPVANRVFLHKLFRVQLLHFKRSQNVSWQVYLPGAHLGVQLEAVAGKEIEY